VLFVFSPAHTVIIPNLFWPDAHLDPQVGHRTVKTILHRIISVVSLHILSH